MRPPAVFGGVGVPGMIGEVRSGSPSATRVIRDREHCSRGVHGAYIEKDVPQPSDGQLPGKDARPVSAPVVVEHFAVLPAVLPVGRIRLSLAGKSASFVQPAVEHKAHHPWRQAFAA